MQHSYDEFSKKPATQAVSQDEPRSKSIQNVEDKKKDGDSNEDDEYALLEKQMQELIDSAPLPQMAKPNLALNVLVKNPVTPNPKTNGISGL